MNSVAAEASLRDRREMREQGFMVIPFPAEIVEDARRHIAAFIADAAPTAEAHLTQAVMSLSDEAFVRTFRKPFRMFPDAISAKVVAWVEGLAGRLGGARAGVNYVAEDEHRANAKLQPDSFDIFWRCVRPGKGDVGAPHCDFQFWEIAKGTSAEPRTPFAYDERWKIWFPISGCRPGNSIEFIPGSHAQDVPIDYIETVNGLKPSIKGDWLAAHADAFVCPFEDFENTCVLFHDKLVHRGPPNGFDALRLSGEFTILLKR